MAKSRYEIIASVSKDQNNFDEIAKQLLVAEGPYTEGDLEVLVRIINGVSNEKMHEAQELTKQLIASKDIPSNIKEQRLGEIQEERKKDVNWGMQLLDDLLSPVMEEAKKASEKESAPPTESKESSIKEKRKRIVFEETSEDEIPKIPAQREIVKAAGVQENPPNAARKSSLAQTSPAPKASAALPQSPQHLASTFTAEKVVNPNLLQKYKDEVKKLKEVEAKIGNYINDEKAVGLAMTGKKIPDTEAQIAKKNLGKKRKEELTAVLMYLHKSPMRIVDGYDLTQTALINQINYLEQVIANTDSSLHKHHTFGTKTGDTTAIAYLKELKLSAEALLAKRVDLDTEAKIQTVNSHVNLMVNNNPKDITRWLNLVEDQINRNSRGAEAELQKLLSNPKARAYIFENHKEQAIRINEKSIELMANKLIAIDLDSTKKIDGYEFYIDPIKGPNPTQNANADFQNKLYAYVVKDILKRETIAERSLAMEFWIRVADKAVHNNILQSLNVAAFIIAAIENPDIDRLKFTRVNISNQAAEMSENIRKIMNPQQSYKAALEFESQHPNAIPFTQMYKGFITLASSVEEPIEPQARALSNKIQLDYKTRVEAISNANLAEKFPVNSTLKKGILDLNLNSSKTEAKSISERLELRDEMKDIEVKPSVNSINQSLYPGKTATPSVALNKTNKNSTAASIPTKSESSFTSKQLIILDKDTLSLYPSLRAMHSKFEFALITDNVSENMIPKEILLRISTAEIQPNYEQKLKEMKVYYIEHPLEFYSLINFGEAAIFDIPLNPPKFDQIKEKFADPKAYVENENNFNAALKNKIKLECVADVLLQQTNAKIASPFHKNEVKVLSEFSADVMANNRHHLFQSSLVQDSPALLKMLGAISQILIKPEDFLNIMKPEKGKEADEEKQSKITRLNNNNRLDLVVLFINQLSVQDLKSIQQFIDNLNIADKNKIDAIQLSIPHKENSTISIQNYITQRINALAPPAPANQNLSQTRLGNTNKNIPDHKKKGKLNPPEALSATQTRDKQKGTSNTLAATNLAATQNKPAKDLLPEIPLTAANNPPAPKPQPLAPTKANAAEPNLQQPTETSVTAKSSLVEDMSLITASQIKQAYDKKKDAPIDAASYLENEFLNKSQNPSAYQLSPKDGDELKKIYNQNIQNILHEFSSITRALIGEQHEKNNSKYETQFDNALSNIKNSVLNDIYSKPNLPLQMLVIERYIELMKQSLIDNKDKFMACAIYNALIEIEPLKKPESRPGILCSNAIAILRKIEEDVFKNPGRQPLSNDQIKKIAPHRGDVSTTNLNEKAERFLSTPEPNATAESQSLRGLTIGGDKQLIYDIAIEIVHDNKDDKEIPMPAPVPAAPHLTSSIFQPPKPQLTSSEADILEIIKLLEQCIDTSKKIETKLESMTKRLAEVNNRNVEAGHATLRTTSR